MKEEGFVKSVTGDMCEVVVKRKTACGENCASCKGACSAPEQICTAKNVVGARDGDRVCIEINTSTVLISAFLLYILPVFVFLTVFLTASENGSSGGASALFAAGAAVLVFFSVMIYDRKHKDKHIPSVTEIL